MTEFDVIAVVFLYLDMTGIVYYSTKKFCADSSADILTNYFMSNSNDLMVLD